jgi:hypothetical protein
MYLSILKTISISKNKFRQCVDRDLSDKNCINVHSNNINITLFFIYLYFMGLRFLHFGAFSLWKQGVKNILF